MAQLPAVQLGELFKAASLLAQRPHIKGWNWPLIFITDQERLGDPFHIVKKLPRQSAVLLRDYAAPNRTELARSLAQICRIRGLLFLVGGDEELAMTVGAGGVHLPENALFNARALKHAHPNWIVTRSAHSSLALRAAAKEGADAALLSPVLPTQSHPKATELGSIRVAQLVRGAKLPVIALGGMTQKTACQFKNSGVAGMAGIDAFNFKK